MLGLIDYAHATRAEFFLKFVLADLLGFDGGLLGFAARASEREDE